MISRLFRRLKRWRRRRQSYALFCQANDLVRMLERLEARHPEAFSDRQRAVTLMIDTHEIWQQWMKAEI